MYPNKGNRNGGKSQKQERAGRKVYSSSAFSAPDSPISMLVNAVISEPDEIQCMLILGFESESGNNEIAG